MRSQPRQDVRGAVVADGGEALPGICFCGGAPIVVLGDVAEAGGPVAGVEQRVAEQSEAVGQQ